MNISKILENIENILIKKFHNFKKVTNNLSKPERLALSKLYVEQFRKAEVEHFQNEKIRLEKEDEEKTILERYKSSNIEEALQQYRYDIVVEEIKTGGLEVVIRVIHNNSRVIHNRMSPVNLYTDYGLYSFGLTKIGSATKAYYEYIKVEKSDLYPSKYILIEGRSIKEAVNFNPVISHYGQWNFEGELPSNFLEHLKCVLNRKK